jgi:hypothetical protein
MEGSDCSGDCLEYHVIDYRVDTIRKELEPGVWALVQGVDHEEKDL